VDGILDTMTTNPHVLHVPTLMGGFGRQGMRDFYSTFLAGRFMPSDAEITYLSHTVGQNRIVLEGVAKFKHTTRMDWLLPGVPPASRMLEIAMVVVVQFEHGNMVSEHVYWDQASVLVQAGLLDPAGLPVLGCEAARALTDHGLPLSELAAASLAR